MNRRDFLVSSGAAAGVAALPVTGTAAVATKATQPARYVWAAALARSRGHVSADVIAQSLKLPMNEAMAVLSKLQARGVVGALGANGLARATAPIFQTGVAAPAQAGLGERLTKTFSDTAEKMVRRAVDDITISDDDPEPPEVSDAERSAE